MASFSQRRYLPVWLILGIGTGLTAIASLIVWHWQWKSQQAHFHNQTDKLATALQQSVDRYLETLQATSNLYGASENISRQEFSVFAKGFLARYPSITALSWSPRVLDRDRAAFEQATQAEGFLQFQITERDAEGNFVRAKRRSEYLPILYNEPLRFQRQLLGFDFRSEPSRAEALERARDRGVLSVTETVKTLSTERTGFLAFQPVYRQNATLDNLQARRENFLGAVVGVFQTSAIVKTAIPEVDLNHLNFYLMDRYSNADRRPFISYNAEQRKLFDQPVDLPPTAASAQIICADLRSCTRVLEVGDRQWLLMVVPDHAFGSEAYWGAWATLLSGLVLTALLTIYVRMALRHTEQVEQLVQERTAQAKELSKTLQELQTMQAQLIQTEKMSSLGQLVAGVAHEINNPVNFIHGNLKHANEYTRNLLKLVQLYQQHYPEPDQEIANYAEAIDLNFLIEDLAKLLTSMGTGTERIRQIVLSLRNFSRFDQAEMKAVDIHEGIDSTLMILQNRLKPKADSECRRDAIEVIKDYGDLPLVECYAGQLNQVFMNILSNAIDALDSAAAQKSPNGFHTEPCTIHIRTEIVGDRVSIRIADNGTGIPDAVKQRLFDPFFTTKPIGKGTGLGLSISYRIVVEKHHGSLNCYSEAGKGTEFHLEIPLHQGSEPASSQLSAIATS
jgi:two-component system, NtrC family, sensor kinase